LKLGDALMLSADSKDAFKFEANAEAVFVLNLTARAVMKWRSTTRSSRRWKLTQAGRWCCHFRRDDYRGKNPAPEVTPTPGIHHVSAIKENNRYWISWPGRRRGAESLNPAATTGPGPDQIRPSTAEHVEMIADFSFLIGSQRRINARDRFRMNRGLLLMQRSDILRLAYLSDPRRQT